MRLVEFFTGFELGGAEKAAISRLEQDIPGVSSTLVVSGPTNRWNRTLIPADVDAIPLREIGRNLHAWTKAEEFDAAVVHTPRESVRLLSSLRLDRSLPVIVVAHNTKPYVSLKGRFLSPVALRLLNRRAAGHIAVSRVVAASSWCSGSRRVVVSHLGSSIVQSNGEATQFVTPWPHGTQIRALSLSRLVSYKGIHILLDAMSSTASQLRASRFHLVVAGDGPSRKDLYNRVIRLGITDLVTFIGESRNPSELLRTADLLLITSLHEGGPLTFYEAMAMGTPVLSTPVGAVCDFALSRNQLRLFSGFGERDIVFGDEGQGWRLMAPDAFLAAEDAVPALQQRLRDYLGA